MNVSTIAPGWYHASGDPVGTVRYWDGNRWVGEAASLDAMAAHQAPSPSASIAPVSDRISGRFFDVIILLALSLPIMWPYWVESFDAATSTRAANPNATDAAIEAAVSDALDALASWRIVAATALKILYDWVFYAFKGATPGKLMVGTRVVTLDGNKAPLGLYRGGLRGLLSALVALAVFAFADLVVLIVVAVGVVSLIMMIVDDRNRTVMDRVASTMVVSHEI